MKFLVYLFLFYVVTRFLFGTLLNFKQESTDYNNSNKKSTDEDEIKINANQHKSAKNKGNSTKPDIGEYVDYEEIK